MKCWLIQYNLIGKLGNGYAIVIAKDAKSARQILTIQGRIAQSGYDIISIIPYESLCVNKCFDQNTIVAEGLVSSDDTVVTIDDIEYDNDTQMLIFKTSDGRSYSCYVPNVMDPLTYYDIISVTN